MLLSDTVGINVDPPRFGPLSSSEGEAGQLAGPTRLSFRSGTEPSYKIRCHGPWFANLSILLGISSGSWDKSASRRSALNPIK